MNRSEQIGQLVAALAQAQAEFLPIEKDRTAKVSSKTGASFSYQYADLASCVDATRPALAKAGLAVLQPVRNDGGAVVVTTLLAHSSGEWISEEMAWPGGGDSRSIGSACSYARRYGYLAILGAVARDEDDDGERAVASESSSAAQPARAATPVASPLSPHEVQALADHLDRAGVKPSQVSRKYGVGSLRELSRAQYAEALARAKSLPDREPVKETRTAEPVTEGV